MALSFKASKHYHCVNVFTENMLNMKDKITDAC
jgi:hypothetical protein